MHQGAHQQIRSWNVDFAMISNKKGREVPWAALGFLYWSSIYLAVVRCRYQDSKSNFYQKGAQNIE